MKTVTVRQALQQVADFPVMLDDDIVAKPVHELVARSLFEIANKPDSRDRGSMTRANRARKMIMDRLVGKRRPGSHPATRVHGGIDFLDLTGKKLEGGESSDDTDPEE